MATEKQIEANRRNALKSTGPRTDPGKEASRGNALKHGLSGRGVVLTDDDQAEVENRLREWSADLPADTPRRRWDSIRVAVESVRIERSQALYFRLCREHADRAAVRWDEDRRREAEELFAGLKKYPALVVRRLESTRQGCERLIIAWSFLGQAIDDQGDWTDAQREDALDLMGQPAGYRDGRTRVDPSQSPDRAAYRREFVRGELDRLRSLISDGLDRLDADAREAASRGVGAELTAPVKQVLRLEAACHRRFRSALKDVDSPQPDTPAVVRAEPEDEAPAELDGPDFGDDLDSIVPLAPIPTLSGHAETAGAPERRLNRHQRRAAEAARRRA